MSGILGDPIDMHAPARRRPSWPSLPATRGLVLRHRTTGHVGHLMRFTPDWITLRDQQGREHVLRNDRGAFSFEGKTVVLVAPPKGPTPTTFTASGSVAVTDMAARVAQPSRILVEGIHDAELVEKVWGADLRIEGVVVQPLHGADDLAEVVRSFGPRPGRRLGVLLDHLVDGSKETRIASTVDHPDVMITGHPYVDIWQAVRPKVLGIERWPEIPKGTDWKRGVCREFGFGGEPGELWKRILDRVSGYQDLEPGLVGAVEQLIDFVAPPTAD
jgi:hypothetical protein